MNTNIILYSIRKYAKKQANRKIRDALSGRVFWHSDEAKIQHMEGVKYIWKPSVEKMRIIYYYTNVMN
jgi:hypothetical protein